MQKHGDYEVVRAIGWGRHATFLLTRSAPGGAPLVLRVSRSADTESVGRVLSSASEQIAALAAGCRSLAPIHASFVDAGGRACVVTDLPAASLADFPASGTRIGPELLQQFVAGVLESLIELQRAAQRSHGNLRLGNVLLDAQDRVRLVDLAPSGVEASVAGDLHTLGELVYLLVHATPEVKLLVPPLAFTSEWNDALGDAGGSWLEITNRLLSRQRHTAPDALERMLADVQDVAAVQVEMRPAPETVGSHPGTGDSNGRAGDRLAREGARRKWIPALAAAAVVVVAFAGWRLLRDDSTPVVSTTVSGPATPTPTPGDPVLKNILADFSTLSNQPPPALRGDTVFRKALNLARPDVYAATNGTAALNVLEDKLRTPPWPVPVENQAFADQWKSQPTWAALVGELEQCAAVELKPGASILPALEAIALANQRAKRIASAWQAIRSALATPALRPGELVPDFSGWAEREIGQARSLEKAAVSAEAVRQTVIGARTFAEQSLPRVVAKRFREDPKARAVLEARPADPAIWMTVATQFFGPSDAESTAWPERVKTEERRIEKLQETEKEQARREIAKLRELMASILANEPRREIEEGFGRLAKMRTQHEKAASDFAVSFNQFRGAAREERTPLPLVQRLVRDIQNAYRGLSDESRMELNRLNKRPFDPNWAEWEKSLTTSDALAPNFADKTKWQLSEADEKADNYSVYYFGGVKIPFLKIPGTQVAMSTGEVPIELANAARLLPEGPGVGPKVWEKTTAGVLRRAPADGLWGSLKDEVITPGRAFDPNSDHFPRQKYLATGLTAYGEGRIPLTWVTFTEADNLARAVGCRLPNVEEWQQAKVAEGAERVLRSTAMATQQSYLEKLIQELVRAKPGTQAFAYGGIFPDTGSYVKSPGPATEPAADGGKVLWLRSADGLGVKAFANLFGNAAEWVQGSQVVGGSCATTMANAEPVRRTGKFFDVGFRLAVEVAPPQGGTRGLAQFREAIGRVPEIPTQ